MQVDIGRRVSDENEEEEGRRKKKFHSFPISHTFHFLFLFLSLSFSFFLTQNEKVVKVFKEIFLLCSKSTFYLFFNFWGLFFLIENFF